MKLLSELLEVCIRNLFQVLKVLARYFIGVILAVLLLAFFVDLGIKTINYLIELWR